MGDRKATPAQATIVYDRDCGFCRWSLSKVLAWDRGRTLRPVALQDPEADGLLAGIPEGTRMESWHLVEPDGVIRSAGAAFAPLFSRLPGGRPLAAFARRLPGAMERSYRLVAGNRTPLGRRLTDGMKRRADARIATRRG